MKMLAQGLLKAGLSDRELDLVMRKNGAKILGLD